MFKKDIRKNITISKTHLQILDPLLKKHEGNLSATVREIIDFVGNIIKKFKSFERAKEVLSKESYYNESFIDSIYGITIPLSMFRWLLSERNASMPSEDEVAQLFLPLSKVENISTLVKVINKKNHILNWPLFVKVHSENSKGNEIVILISGADPIINKFEAMLISIYLANLPEPYEIDNLLNLPSSIQIKFKKSTKDASIKTLHQYYRDASRLKKEVI